MKGSHKFKLPEKKSDFTINVSSMWDYVKLVINTIRFIQTQEDLDKINKSQSELETLKIVVGKSTRAFIYLSCDKYLTFVFPICLKKKEGKLKLYCNSYELTGKIVSELKSILDLHYQDRLKNLIELYDTLQISSKECMEIFEYLLTCEPGYLRYDFDKVSARGQIHPINHLDVNFSDYATYKYGLYERLSIKNFENIFMKEKDCFYIGEFIPYFNNWKLKSTQGFVGKKGNRKRQRKG